MKYNLVTWNLWNSFKALKSPMEVDFAEPWARIQQRKRMQEDCLLDESVDVFLLQEVNPIGKRLKFFKQKFASINHQTDQGGLRLLGVGLPFYFENALVNLSKHNLRFKKGLRLSSDFGVNTKFFSMQFTELRYALFSELDLYDERILLVNTHLHHGIEWTKSLKQDIDTLYASGELNQEQYDNILYGIANSTKRKREELMQLMAEIKDWQADYTKIIIAGDFNLSEDSDYLEIVKTKGFKNYHLNPEYSWSKEENYENLIFSNQMLPPLKDLESLPLLETLKKHNLRSRNIDHFFVSDSIKVNQVSAFANEKMHGHNFLPSDHIGVKIEIEV